MRVISHIVEQFVKARHWWTMASGYNICAGKITGYV
jgi:hypothetical protein